MKKIIAIPYDKDWFRGGNHFFNDLVKSFGEVSNEGIVFKIVDPDKIKDNNYDGILSIRCHFLKSIDLKSINVPVFLYHDDFHYYNYRRILPSKELEKIISNVELYFTPYLNYFDFNLFRKHFHKSYWVPWSVPASVLEETKFEGWDNREARAIISGMDSFFYPLRRRIYRYSRRFPNDIILGISHPSYEKDKGIIGDDYYALLRRFKGAFATTGKTPINFSVMKYFEIPACGCLPFFEDNIELKYLGFRDGDNCVLINDKNFQKKIRILSSPFAVQIAQNANNLIRNYHTHDNRIDYIASKIEKYFQNK